MVEEKKKIKKCLFCGKEFESNSSNRAKKYCSISCGKKWRYWNTDAGKREIETSKMYRENNLKKVREKDIKRNSVRYKRLRIEVLSNYSDGKFECECCKENNIEFLCIDHITGGGVKHRKEVGGGNNLYRWLKNNNFPKGFRVLCHNCNMSLGLYGYCPHKK